MPPFFMVAEQQERLKLIVRNLKSLVEVLESEVFSDISKYNYLLLWGVRITYHKAHGLLQ